MSNLESLHFVQGQILKANHLNAIRDRVLQLAVRRQVPIDPIDLFEDGHVLCSRQVNALKDGVSRISAHLDYSHQWSFPPFQDGDVLHAEPMNEIVQQLLRIS